MLMKQLERNQKLLKKEAKESETFKERSQDLDEIIDKHSKPSDYDENDQVTFEFEFFTGGVNPKFDSFVKRYGLTNENIQFVDFLQSDYCKVTT